MLWLNGVLVLFSILNVALGVYGYLVKGSIVSLIAGFAVGLLMLGTVALAKSHPRWGRIGSLLVCLAVIGQFLPKFMKDRDWFPAGVLACSAVAVVICLVAGHLIGNGKKVTANPNA